MQVLSKINAFGGFLYLINYNFLNCSYLQSGTYLIAVGVSKTYQKFYKPMMPHSQFEFNAGIDLSLSFSERYL
ncbi:hypothetical protein Dfri01_34230 [Dyadobacter frigoris]|nr:hypothetical protein Dfri01_34230 [Dyadobacter frigoris]